MSVEREMAVADERIRALSNAAFVAATVIGAWIPLGVVLDYVIA